MAQHAYDIQPQTSAPPLAHSPLHGRHIALGARMVAFAGYDMPVQYPSGVLAEHKHTRTQAGLFDVSHMGQIELTPFDTQANAADIFEELVAGGIANLEEGQMRYTQFMNAQGGILDDLMVTRFGKQLWLVVNAACKQADETHIRATLGGKLKITMRQRALLALQGPEAAAVLTRLIPEAAKLSFMAAQWVRWQGEYLLVSRCGYTGEDGFEISIPNGAADSFMAALLTHAEVAPVGLGARDSLRLEAGLCLYGHDMDSTTTPLEASLAWSIPKRRLTAGGFVGAAIVQGQVESGLEKKRVGLLPEGRAIPREGASIMVNDKEVGHITSGGFSPSLECGIAMGYVAIDFAAPDTSVIIIVRDKPIAARIVPLPFVPHNYHRGA
ncbi:MAG: glycine cleavage system aminomethyltransferase GcvT [Alphaproteobacteria bacterium]|nr:glycine cleavage system aminomethyltransferase GcvT [Alphaproteobacteria bacterium]